MNKIKHTARFVITNIQRFLYNKYATIYFIFRGCNIRKPLHLQGIKYIELGDNVRIDSFARLDCYDEKGDNHPQLIIEDDVMICFNFTALCSSKIRIEKNTTIASHVFISTENHGMDPTLGDYIKQKLVSKDVNIGEHCWIGEKVCILPGVTIGKYCIVGAGSVVTKDISDYCIVVGNPARVVKKFDFDSNVWRNVEGD